ncbi:MAG: hypothetical protein K5893_05555 [Prevotella sp.]|nr:hypothetical protein [Prevotella sp.]
MEKKLLLICAFAAIVLGASAQQWKVFKDLGQTHKSGKFLAPAQADEEEGIIWGYYLGDLSDSQGLGFAEANASYDVAIFVPGNKELKGGKITAIRVPVGSSKMSSLTVWIRSSLNGTNLVYKTYSGDLTEYTYLEIPLDEPFDIPATGVYVGYSFGIKNGTSDNDLYPIITAGTDIKDALWVTESRQWMDLYGNDFGVSCLNIRVTDISVEANGTYFSPINNGITLAGHDSPVKAQINVGYSTGINNIDYTIIYADGSKKSYNKDVQIGKGFNQAYTTDIDVLGPQEATDFTARITVDKVNGEDNILKDTVTLKAKNISRQVPRRTVVEEFTGTQCGWCPRGWVGMEKLKKNNPDNFIGIAVHQYTPSPGTTSNDPMYVANYFQFADGAPQCIMDRKKLMDPYYGTNHGIQYDFDNYNSIIPEADITLNAEWINEKEEEVKLSAEVEYLSTGGKYSVAFVLTADSLSGTTNAWKQANYYSKYGSRNDLPEDLQPFWDASSYVSLVFNDVMINSSYSNTGSNKAGNFADPAEAGKTAAITYNLRLPTKTVLKNAIDKKLVFGVALLFNIQTKEIANAARVQVMPYVDTAIKSIENGSSTVTETARYTLDGQRIYAPQKGVNIVKMSNGGIRKIIVR